MRRNRKWLLGLAPFIAAGFVFVIGELVMNLWNWIAAGSFGLPRLTFWQAWGLLLLCRILFGSLHGGGGPREKLSREERRRIREKLSLSSACDATGGDAPATS